VLDQIADEDARAAVGAGLVDLDEAVPGVVLVVVLAVELEIAGEVIDDAGSLGRVAVEGVVTLDAKILVLP